MSDVTPTSDVTSEVQNELSENAATSNDAMTDVDSKSTESSNVNEEEEPLKTEEQTRVAVEETVEEAAATNAAEEAAKVAAEEAKKAAEAEALQKVEEEDKIAAEEAAKVAAEEAKKAAEAEARRKAEEEAKIAADEAAKVAAEEAKKAAEAEAFRKAEEEAKIAAEEAAKVAAEEVSPSYTTPRAASKGKIVIPAAFSNTSTPVTPKSPSSALKSPANKLVIPAAFSGGSRVSQPSGATTKAVSSQEGQECGKAPPSETGVDEVAQGKEGNEANTLRDKDNRAPECVEDDSKAQASTDCCCVIV
jgi:membrane protein involved in colicin uptake